MTIERAWIGKQGALEEWKEIDDTQASKELANQFGGTQGTLDEQRVNALDTLKEKKELSTRFGTYKIS